MNQHCFASLAVVLVLGAATSWPSQQQATAIPTNVDFPTGQPAAREQMQGTESTAGSLLADLPLTFVENRGQWPAKARFVARRGAMVVTLEQDAVRLRLGQRSTGKRVEDTRLRLVFEGASPSARLEGEQRLPGIYNYFIGNDPGKWRAGASGYERVRYRGIHPGVDLLVHEGEKGLEYDLELAPGAGLDQVVVRCEGVDSLHVGEDGRLVMKTPWGDLEQTPPVAWQTLPDGSHLPVDCRFHLLSDSSYGFAVGGLDPDLALTVDPQIDYATYLGGSSGTNIAMVAVDSQGFIYITGNTNSPDFVPAPTATHGNIGMAFGVAFLAKLDPGATGNSVVFLSMFGGGSDTAARVLALGPFESAVYVGGNTNSADFPTLTLNPALSAYNGGNRDGFLVCLDTATGATMLYGVLLGGSGADWLETVAVDSLGNAHIAGFKVEDGTPSIGGDPNTQVHGPLGNKDAFVVVLDATGNSVLVSALIGGSSDVWVEAIDIDSGGNTYLAGWTGNDPANQAGWFPTTADALKTGPAEGGPGGGQNTGDGDGFLVRLDALLALEYSTLLGGNKIDLVFDMTFSNGRAYLTGRTASSDFPTANPSIDTSIGLTGDTLSGARDAFVTIIDFTSFDPGSVAPNLAFSTYIGGGTHDEGHGIVVDGDGRIHLAGNTNATPVGQQKEYPQVGSPQYKLGQDARDGFLTIFVPATNGYSVVYSTLFGGNSLDISEGLALGPQGEIHLLLSTISSDLFTTPNAVLSSISNSIYYLGYVMKIPSPNFPTFGTVSGTVTNFADSSAISGALVEADSGESTLTLSDGSYSFGVLAGDRTVTVSASAFDSQNQVVTVTENTTTTADFALDESTGGGSGGVDCITYDTSAGPAGDKHLHITVSIVDGSGVPVSGSSVTVDVDLDGVFLLSFSGTTHASGEVSTSINNADSGVYVCDVTALTGVTGDPAEPANSHDKGTDPVPDVDCN